MFAASPGVQRRGIPGAAARRPNPNWWCEQLRNRGAARADWDGLVKATSRRHWERRAAQPGRCAEAGCCKSCNGPGRADSGGSPKARLDWLVRGAAPPPRVVSGRERGVWAAMRITCPACSTAYDVPDERIAPGRPVRCARCGNGWTPVLATPAPAVEDARTPDAPADAPVPIPAAPQRSAPPVPERPFPPIAPVVQRRWLPAAAWAATLAILAVLGWALYMGRREVVRAWPPSERLYAALGLLPSNEAPPRAPTRDGTGQANPPPAGTD